jgi:hypothetical protein
MFVQAQRIGWQSVPWAGTEARIERKLLSADAHSGACTALLRYPAGWSRPDAEFLDAMEEFYVLDGEITIGGQRYHHDCYACLPAGFVREGAFSAAGAVVLAMWSRAPRAWPGRDVPAGSYDPALLVPLHDAHARGLESWERNTHTRYLVGTGVQTLRVDPYTKEITILYAALPFRFMEKRWTHEHVQEMFVLAGEYSINDVGVMRPGAYAWWEPEHVHGPYGSLTGFMMLIRSCGGPLVNVIPDERVAVDFAAPYRPVLPPGLAGAAGASAPFTRY